MHSSLTHLPANKQADIARIVLLIRKFVDEARKADPKLGGFDASAEGGRIEQIILFGSHARGDWEYDNYVEDGITYEYVSDYDILVITDDSRLPDAHAVWNQVRDRFAEGRESKGPSSAGLSLIVHTIKEVNRALAENNSFFHDVKKEGLLLYDAGGITLGEARELTSLERTAKAQEEFDRWFKNAQLCLDAFQIFFDRGEYNYSAFHLHQATENLYITSSMVFTDYRPKLHDLFKLERRVREYDKRLRRGFAHHTAEQKRMFQLLADAYIHARYTKSYTIAKADLEYLAQRVRKLQTITEEVCRERIAAYGGPRSGAAGE